MTNINDIHVHANINANHQMKPITVLFFELLGYEIKAARFKYIMTGKTGKKFNVIHIRSGDIVGTGDKWSAHVFTNALNANYNEWYVTDVGKSSNKGGQWHEVHIREDVYLMVHDNSIFKYF